MLLPLLLACASRSPEATEVPVPSVATVSVELVDADLSWAAALVARASGLDVLVMGAPSTAVRADVVDQPAQQVLSDLARQAGMELVLVDAERGPLHLVVPSHAAAALRGSSPPRPGGEGLSQVRVGQPLAELGSFLAERGGRGGGGLDGGRATVAVADQTASELVGWLRRGVEAGALAQEGAGPPPPGCPGSRERAVLACAQLDGIGSLGLARGSRDIVLLQGGGGLALAEDRDQLGRLDQTLQGARRWQLRLDEDGPGLLLGDYIVRSLVVGSPAPSLCAPDEETRFLCQLGGLPPGEQVAVCGAQDALGLRVGTMAAERWSVLAGGGGVRLRPGPVATEVLAGTGERRRHLRRLPVADQDGVTAWALDEAGPEGSTRRACSQVLVDRLDP